MERIVERRTGRKRPDSRKLITEYYDNYKTTKELANEYKVTEGTIRNWLVVARKELGVVVV